MNVGRRPWCQIAAALLGLCAALTGSIGAAGDPSAAPRDAAQIEPLPEGLRLISGDNPEVRAYLQSLL